MKLYPVQLTAEQQQTLEHLIHRGSAPAQVHTRARILLLAARGLRDEDIAPAALTSRSTVQRTRQRFVTGNLAMALYERPRSGRPVTFTGDVEAQLTTLACSAPPPGAARWTLRLLADRLVELAVVDTISPTTVGTRLKKTRSTPGG